MQDLTPCSLWLATVRELLEKWDIAMSKELLVLAQAFAEKRIDPIIFAKDFMNRWKHERDCGENLSDPPQLSEVLSSIFCLTDMFNPDIDKEDYEFDEPQLRSEIEKLLWGMSS